MPPSPRPSTPPSPPARIRYDKDFTILYIDNTGYLDLDKPAAWNADQDENANTVDLAINPTRVIRRTFGTVAPSRTGTKPACTIALNTHPASAATGISMAQLRRDRGFCARSATGTIAYIRFINLRAGDDDAIQLHVTAYN
ncbi:hypothetical protein ACI2LF_12950 [Kribbella sp. NPDC020789]